MGEHAPDAERTLWVWPRFPFGTWEPIEPAELRDTVTADPIGPFRNARVAPQGVEPGPLTVLWLRAKDPRPLARGTFDVAAIAARALEWTRPIPTVRREAEYWVPSADERRVLQQAGHDPENPSWQRVQAELQHAGHAPERLGYLDAAAVVKAIGQPLHRSRECRRGDWFAKATKDGLSAEALRKAATRSPNPLEGEQRDRWWHYPIDAVCSRYPQHEPKIRQALESE